MNLRKITNKAFLFVLSFVAQFKKRNINVTSDKVLIVMSGLGLGDGLLFYNCLYEISKHYDDDNIIIVAPKSIIDLYKLIFKEFRFSYVSFYYANIYEYMKIVKNLGERGYRLIINPNHFRKDIDVLVKLLDADRKISMQTNRNNLFARCICKVSSRSVYDEILYIEPGTMELKRYCLLYEMCTKKNMLCRKPALKEKVSIGNNKQAYIVVAVGSSNEARCWEAEKYAEIIGWIINETKLDVYVTGSNEIDRKHISVIKSQLRESRRVKYMLDMNGLDEWMKLISGARFLVGNDSGAAHMGVFLGVYKVFVISDKSRKIKDNCRYFPYVVDDFDIEKLPIVIRSEADYRCEGCAEISNGVYGYGNHCCKKRITKGMNCLCLKNIDVNYVLDVIGGYLEGTIC